jgi:hypothetical protein
MAHRYGWIEDEGPSALRGGKAHCDLIVDLRAGPTQPEREPEGATANHEVRALDHIYAARRSDPQMVIATELAPSADPARIWLGAVAVALDYVPTAHDAHGRIAQVGEAAFEPLGIGLGVIVQEREQILGRRLCSLAHRSYDSRPGDSHVTTAEGAAHGERLIVVLSADHEDLRGSGGLLLDGLQAAPEVIRPPVARNDQRGRRPVHEP